ncbi:MAG: M81 family metallopeptidase [Alphaproteobacteria bacterium]
MARIAIGGFQHETNTFAPSSATFEDFATAGAWPGLTRGAAMIEATDGLNIPIAGFIETARSDGHELLPLLWAQATPSGHVTEDTFNRIIGQIVSDLKDLRHVDAVYLDLHGAMVCAHMEDGEGEILRQVRAVVGPDVPVVASLDLHANVTPQMMALSDRLIAFRTYPHVDMAQTGSRSAMQVVSLLRDGAARAKAFRQIPFLIPVQTGCTMIEPAKSLYARLPEIERGPVASVSFAAGFAPADIHHCGPSVMAYAADTATAERAVDDLVHEIVAKEAAFVGKVWPLQEAVTHAIAQAAKAGRPIILADSQDNPGAGGNSDTVGLLAELIRQDAVDAVLGLLYDPEAAEAAHAAGEGAQITYPLGAKSGLPGHEPLCATYHVERIGDGAIIGTGPFYKDARMQLGPMALLRVKGVSVVVASRKNQAADQAMFRHLGVEPSAQKILALKSSVHFRADFQPIAEEILVVAAPGPNPLDYRELPYRNLRPGLRITPMGAAFKAKTSRKSV